MRTAQQQRDSETPPEQSANVENALGMSDRTLIAETDGALLLKLEAAWWDDHRDEFALEFEESASYHDWMIVAAAKVAKCEADIAEQIRKHIERTGEVPDAFCD